MISWNTPGFGFRVRHDLLKFSGFRVWELCMTSWTVSDSECWGLRFSSVGSGGSLFRSYEWKNYTEGLGRSIRSPGLKFISSRIHQLQSLIGFSVPWDPKTYRFRG